VLTEIDPKIAIKKVKIISSLLKTINQPRLKGEFCLIFKTIFEYISENSQVNENVSLKVMKDLTDIVEKLITQEPLILIFSSLELLLTLSKLRGDFTALITLFMKCLMFLKSQNANLN